MVKLGAHLTNKEQVSEDSWRLFDLWQPASFLWTPWIRLEDVIRGLHKFSDAVHIMRIEDFDNLERVKVPYSRGIDGFQLGNEPPIEFGGTPEQWNKQVREFLGRNAHRFPDVLWLYPPMPVDPQYHKANEAYWRDAADIISRSDVQLAAHAYWQPVWAMADRTWGRYYEIPHEMYPDKDIYLTEFGNVLAETNKEDKARQYVEYAEGLPEYIKAACLWGMDMTDDWEASNVNITEEMVRIFKEREE